MKLKHQEYDLTAEADAWPWSRALAFVLLSGYMLFAHGCHGNDDHELLDSLWSRASISPSVAIQKGESP
jgi:hypothetical protein